MTRCAQPGCTGSILDGYCDVCGSPAASAPAQAPSQTTGVSASTSPAGVLPHSVARGQGLRQPQHAAPAAPDGAAPGVGSTRTRASSRLDSTALGSSRATASGSPR